MDKQILEVPEIRNASIGQSIMSEMREQKLLDHRKIYISEGVSSDTARRVVADLLLLDATSHDPIEVYINSPGGEVNSGFAIYDTIRFIKSEVKIINAGLCASIATIINIAVPKEKRYSMPNSKFLIHQPLIMGHVQGQASDLEITAQQILITREKINKYLAEACGQSVEKVSEDTIRDYWMNAVEAIEYGLIGKIVDSYADVK